MFFSPFHDDYVISFLPYNVVDVVRLSSLMFDKNFLARSFRSMNADKKNVCAYLKIRQFEAVSKAHKKKHINNKPASAALTVN